VTILLVRHARAGRRERWKGDDRLRPLSPKGHVQATALPAVLEPWTAVAPLLVSSPWKRCVQTLGPLASGTGAAVRADDLLGEGRGSDAADRMADWIGPRPVVLCTHGDVIEEVLARVLANGIDLGREPTAAKGSVWVLEGTGGAVVSARYLAPPA